MVDNNLDWLYNYAGKMRLMTVNQIAEIPPAAV